MPKNVENFWCFKVVESGKSIYFYITINAIIS